MFVFVLLNDDDDDFGDADVVRLVLLMTKMTLPLLL